MLNEVYEIWVAQFPKSYVVIFERLLAWFGDAESIWKANETELIKSGFVPITVAAQISSSKFKKSAERIFEQCQKNKIKILFLKHDEYPKMLKHISSPPRLLYCLGNLDVIGESIAIVGSRKATYYGQDMAYKLGYEFASYGMTVVSGLAKGIDAFAHSGALKAGGKTIAVMGCGVDVIYPNENFRLYNDIKDNGLIISEQPPGAIPFAGNFPTRNRIISGLSKGVVVVEAGKKSGSLITAEFAADQGRDVFAVPGDINKNNSKGTNELIRDGAHLIGCINDIFEIIGSTKDPDYINRQNYVEKIDEYVCLSGYEQKVFEELKYEYMNIEQLFAKTKIPMDELLVSLSLLEIKGKIICNSNKKYVIL